MVYLKLEPKYSKVRSQLYDLGAIDKETLSEEGNYLLEIKISKEDFDRFKRETNLDLEQLLTIV